MGYILEVPEPYLNNGINPLQTHMFESVNPLMWVEKCHKPPIWEWLVDTTYFQVKLGMVCSGLTHIIKPARLNIFITSTHGILELLEPKAWNWGVINGLVDKVV